MDVFRGRVISDEDIQVFCLQLSDYSMQDLCNLYNYFKNDLVYIIESLDAMRILNELSFRNIIGDHERYLSLIEQCGVSAFSVTLVQDIFDLGKDAVIGLWGSLYAMQSDFPHPNLLGVLDEIIKTGVVLLVQIHLDENGVYLPEDLRATQYEHKFHLLNKTEKMVEHQAPGFSYRPQTFHISERYLDVIVVSSQQFRTRSQHEVIETGGIHEHYLQAAHTKLERISPNKIFRWCHRSSCMPQSVLVSGVPGVGKTTLMQKFVYDWVKGHHYQRFSFIFFFKFRTLNSVGELSLVDLVLKEYPHLQKNLGAIFKEPEKLLFIFDGLDESVHQMDFTSERLCGSQQSQENLSVLVVSLVRQTLLKGSFVLITSRPTKLANIKTEVFQRVSEIMGFFPKERRKYFDNFFRDDKLSEMAFNYVRENGILYTFCYIPSYCWILCTVLETCFKNSGKVMELLPKTVTQLFVTFIANILTNHSQDTSTARGLLTTLGWMAKSGVMEHKLAFEEQDLYTYGINTSSPLLSSFMIESIQESRRMYSFFHLTIQEFLAALVHYLDFSEEKLKESLQVRYLEDGRGEMFLRFLCGLSDGSTRALLNPYLPFCTQTSRHVITWLSDSVRPDRESYDKRQILNVFASLFESRNRALVSQSFGSNRKFEFPEFHLAPLDCTVLSFILDCCHDPELLDLDTCFIQTEGLERLYSVLHKVRDLRLSSNDLKDKDLECIYKILTNPSCRILSLSLKNNFLTEKCCAALATALAENQTLRVLDLSKNHLGGPELEILLTVLSSPECKIEHLLLKSTKLTHEHAPYLISLSDNPNLTHLDISFNYFADSGFESIQKLLKRSTSLREIKVQSNDFSNEREADLRNPKIYRPDLNIIV